MARTKGSPNKATKAREQVLSEQGLMPLSYLLSVLRDETQDQPTRMDAAKSAAPYCHPKLTSAEVKHSGQIDFRKLLTELE